MISIYHNPRCSKSRQTLGILAERGIVPTIIEYIKYPPDAGELARVAGLLGMGARDMMRTGEARYGALGLDDPALGEAELFQAMAENPALIERPIVLANGQARIGRPPENVIDIL